MPKEQEDFQAAVDSILEVAMFENWLRFYFLQETEKKDENGNEELIFFIPDKGLDKIKELYPHLFPMAERINGKVANATESQKAVFTHIFNELDGKAFPKGTASVYLDTKAFKVGYQLFNIWVEAYEKHLDEQFLEFGMWRRIFKDWRATEVGKDLEMKIEMSAPSSQKN